MKKLKKLKEINFLSLLLAGLMILSFSSTPVSALTQNSNQILVDKYLTALKNKDIPTIVELSVDERMNNQLDYQIKLEKLLQDPNQQIEKFNILDNDRNLNEYSIVYAEIEFLNGDVMVVPFRVQEGIVYIGKNDTLPKIKTGIEIPYSAPVPRAQVVYWDFTLSLNSYDTQYTSDFSYSSNSTTLNFRQWTPSNAPVAARVEYAVVKYSIFGDTVYSSQVVSGDNQSSAKQITLSLGSGQTFNNLCIRVDNYNYSYPTASYGEAYCY